MLLSLLLRNHVLANLLFALVMVMGFASYLSMPREQDPEINFNFIVVTAIFPGASAEDVERRVLDPLEDAIRNVKDIDYVSSNARESIATLVIRFEDIDDRVFDKRVSDLRREVTNKEDELPAEVDTPDILEITSANAFPTVTLVVVGQAADETLRRQAYNVQKDIERLEGVDRVESRALYDPELQVRFDPLRLEQLGIAPNELADTVALYFRDTAAGRIDVSGSSWLVRLIGTDTDPGYLGALPVTTAEGEVPLDSVARVVRGRERAQAMVSADGKPAVLLAVMKKAQANTLELVDRISAYAEERNALAAQTGVRLLLIDDQSQITRNAIRIMQTNAAYGLILVLAVTWIFLGTRIALLTTIGIPFVLAGTFWSLASLDQTLNVSVLLGVVIVLGMLVDDAVVVVESIYHRLLKGEPTERASLAALREVAAPVTTAVLTTMAAFLPLMLLPGILGQFMRIIPMVVTTALAISLLEAFWMLPAHMMAFKVGFAQRSRVQRWRERSTHRLQIAYTRALIKVLRRPVLSLTAVVLLFLGALVAFGSGLIRMDYFASDTLRLFYVNVEMDPSTPLEQTQRKVEEVEARVRANLEQRELRGIASYSGIAFTETAPLLGDQYGQILVGLQPQRPDMRSVEQIIEDMRENVTSVPGAISISFLTIAGGPPTSKPINIKVRGDEYSEIRSAAEAIKTFLREEPAIIDITDDASRGRSELVMRVDEDAVRRTRIDPATVARNVALLVDGEVVADTRDEGEKLEVRILADDNEYADVRDLLDQTLPLPDGGRIPLRELVEAGAQPGLGNIRHYDFKRAITIEADLKPGTLDAVQANAYVKREWAQIASRYPNVSLNFSGMLDDIQESLDALPILALMGIGIMYLILGTQFRSYFQPLMILLTVPMAGTGVVLGLLITGNPASLFTLYGVVALAGIAVNAAIVLISAANDRLRAGMSVKHATLYAARRRVIPILITTLTTIAGLFSLATGLGGRSLMWSPVATAIVWGLGFSATLTLFVIPLVYRLTMPWSHMNTRGR
jgi:multidrug efflux pump subunit AcrB